MIDGGLDYDKTVETNKIVFKGQTYQKVTSYIFILIMVSWALGVSYYTFIYQINNSPTTMDYFMTVLFIVVIFALVCYEIRVLLTRNKLKQFEINIGLSLAKTRLLEAAGNLNWELYSNFDHYMIFRTENIFFVDCQTITLIIFPNDIIYFHSINFPNDYLRPSLFDNNYEKLLNEFQKCEKG